LSYKIAQTGKTGQTRYTKGKTRKTGNDLKLPSGQEESQKERQLHPIYF
jgi:hypothetical protein